MRKLLPTLVVLGLGFAFGAIFAGQSPSNVVAQVPNSSNPSPLGSPYSGVGAADSQGPGYLTTGSTPMNSPVDGVSVGGAFAASNTPPVSVIQARPGRDVAGSGDFIGFANSDDSGTQVITLVNTQKLWMAVYHVGPTGEVRLASSRAIDADFTLQLNATSPTPDEIRRLHGLPRDRE